MRENLDMARRIIRMAVKKVSEKRECECANALAGAIVTDPVKIPAAQKTKLELLIKKYVK
jgi:hypothetical protein